jgi:uncharacterized membrane protein
MNISIKNANQMIDGLVERPPMSKRADHILNFCFAISVALTGVVCAIYTLQFAAIADTLDSRQIFTSSIYIAMLTLSAAGCLAIVVYNFSTHMKAIRIIARITMVLLLIDFVMCIAISGLHPLELVYLFQIGSLIVFQLYTDQKLARNSTFSSPWDMSKDKDRSSYIPLNFFNIFWVFLISSILGLVVEVIYHALVFGGYQDRAGMLWGPFSPIYGFGAVLITIALNRFWNRNGLIIFLIAGIIGAAFEFFVSFFMETAFGIVAWDYSGTFLNIQGRTNFAFFCAWGLLGVVWIKLILPTVLRVVDAIPLKLRAGLTVIFALFMIADGVMTMATLDSWYERQANEPAITSVEKFCEKHYDDEFMENRFESMSIDPDLSSRIH